MVIGNFTFTYHPPDKAISVKRMRAAIYWEVCQIPEAARTMESVRAAVDRAVQRLVEQEPEIDSVDIHGSITL